MVRTDLKDDSLVDVFNDSYGVVGYSTDKVSKDFPKDSKKKVTLAELEDVMNSAGGKQLFLKNRLLIKDARVREYFDLPELGENNLSREQIKALLQSEDLKQLEEVLSYCSDDVLDKIVQESIEVGINSVPQAGLIRSYSGVNVLAAIEEKAPIQETSAPVAKTSDRKYARKKITE